MSYFKMFFFFLTTLILTTNSALFSTPQESPALGSRRIVNFSPPSLEPKNIKKKYVCIRPNRVGGPNISLEEGLNGTPRINIYGNGSYGWSTCLGSVQKGIKLFQEKYKPEKDTSITILGRGCIGLFTAAALDHLGYTNIKIIANEAINIPSFNAGGLFAASQNLPSHLMDVFIDTYNGYRQIISNQHPYLNFLKDYVKEINAYFMSEDDSDLTELVNRGLIPPPERVKIDFRNGTSHDMFGYNTLFLHVRDIMEKLTDYLQKKNVPFITKKISSFEEIDSKIIFNCTGLGSQELNKDGKLYGARGHMILLKEQPLPPPGCESILTAVIFGEETSQDIGDGKKIYRFPYFMPKEEGVVGGTFIPEGVDVNDKEEFKKILLNAKKFFGFAPS